MRSLPTLPGDPGELAEAYAYPVGRVHLRANMVAALDGAAWHGDRTEVLGGDGDRRLFGLLRGLADVIIVGAGTVRTEKYGPVRPRESWRGLREGRPEAPPLAIVSRRLDLDLDSAVFTEAASRTIVLTTETAPAAAREAVAERAEVIVTGRDGIDFRHAVAELSERGYRRLLCEGGPQVLARAAMDGVLDELCLTISPLLTSGDAARILNGPPLPSPERMRLTSCFTEEDFLFLRYQRPE